MAFFSLACLAILAGAKLAESAAVDPQLQRIDRFLERSYRQRILRNMELAAQESTKWLSKNDERVTTKRSDDADDADDLETPKEELEEGFAEDSDKDSDGEADFYNAISDDDTKDRRTVNTNSLLVEKDKYEEDTGNKHQENKHQEHKHQEHKHLDNKENEHQENTERRYVPVPHPVPIIVHKLIPVPLILPQPFMVPESMQAAIREQAQQPQLQRPLQRPLPRPLPFPRPLHRGR